MKEWELRIRPAKLEEHPRLLAIAKQHKPTRDFSHMMFSGEAAYKRGWIRLCELWLGGQVADIVGFTCVRHKVREPETALYYIAVESDYRDKGIGTALLHDLQQNSPHKRIVLNVTKDNTSAQAFYAKHGFRNAGDSLDGNGYHLILDW